MPRVVITILVVCFSCLACPSESAAWNAAGHRTISSILFRRLSEERRLELAELLTHHPRYQEDFLRELPTAVADASDRAEWLLQQAAVWPDLVRGGPPERRVFNRPLWHYLPRAFYLEEPSSEFRTKVDGGLNSALEPVGGTANHDLNGPQAFQANLTVLKDETASKSDRAVALCWVLHIGQDLHQPCHTASLCTPHLFPEGDRGANSIKTRQQKNLHAIWDSSLGPNNRFEHCRDLAITLTGGMSLETLGQPVSAVNTDVAKWLEEGLVLEREAVYSGEIRDAIQGAETAGATELAEITLTVDYLRNVRKVADQRFVTAGSRLAEILK